MSRGVGEGGVLVVGEGSTTTARLVSLEAYTNYSLVAAAATTAGVGVHSSPVVCRTLQAGGW